MTSAKARTTTRKWADIEIGDEVTALEIPITTTMIVAGAIASRDFMPVHHDRDYANKQGSPNLFINILTTNGYCVRFLTDWAGPEAMVKKLPAFMAHYAPFGLLTPAAWVALHAQRYMSTHGVTNEDFGRIAVVDHTHAASNPDAWFYQRPITLQDHQNSRWIVAPVLRLLDCCQESDGGVALVVTSAERARDLRQPPAVIAAAAQGAARDGEMMTSYYREEITGLPEMGVVAARLWRDSGLEPQDIQTVFIYDHFTPFFFTQLEELGFCGRGEAKDFATVERLSLGGELPINTNGGLLGEAYIHGMNGITEGVRQIRGTSYNQVDNFKHVLVTSGTGVPTSGLILAPSG